MNVSNASYRRNKILAQSNRRRRTDFIKVFIASIHFETFLLSLSLSLRIFWKISISNWTIVDKPKSWSTDSIMDMHHSRLCPSSSSNRNIKRSKNICTGIERTTHLLFPHRCFVRLVWKMIWSNCWSKSNSRWKMKTRCDRRFEGIWLWFNGSKANWWNYDRRWSLDKTNRNWKFVLRGANGRRNRCLSSSSRESKRRFERWTNPSTKIFRKIWKVWPNIWWTVRVGVRVRVTAHELFPQPNIFVWIYGSIFTRDEETNEKTDGRIS